MKNLKSRPGREPGLTRPTIRRRGVRNSVLHERHGFSTSRTLPTRSAVDYRGTVFRGRTSSGWSACYVRVDEAFPGEAPESNRVKQGGSNRVKQGGSTVNDAVTSTGGGGGGKRRKPASRNPRHNGKLAWCRKLGSDLYLRWWSGFTWWCSAWWCLPYPT
ncbi:hypothetical protein GEV33_004591 [Tenebrio molitor]|uniref:Uncharacterized protein n=1 Tax=Tenebrio molitor TaxID=7067 RepID=A0A8J6HG67_TENMO|nr:hypothetical protein GEV33_004591 [Tenebrio molitor]